MWQERQYCVYIITNKYNTVLYTGVTSNLERRMSEHRNKLNKGFSSKYRINKLVYYEETSNVYSAIEREKQIKGKSHMKKRALVTSQNHKWKDLSKELFSERHKDSSRSLS